VEKEAEMVNGLLAKNFLANEIKQHPDISVKRAAKGLNVSLSTFYAHWGSNLTPKKFLICKRLFMALKLLAKDKRICEVADELKFCDHIYFSQWFKRFCGISPKQFQLKYCSDFRSGNFKKICQELKELNKDLVLEMLPKNNWSISESRKGKGGE
jgi:AraC-like DNA-binding protein